MTGEAGDGELDAVIGVGFREAASAKSILAAVAQARALSPKTLVLSIATADDKAGSEALRAAASRLALPVRAIAADALARADAYAATRSARVEAHRGIGSLCEAAALAACGEGARLVVTRVIAPDRMASAAIAVRARPLAQGGEE